MLCPVPKAERNFEFNKRKFLIYKDDDYEFILILGTRMYLSRTKQISTVCVNIAIEINFELLDYYEVVKSGNIYRNYYFEFFI